ncbi:phosphate acyltransferase PlsX [Desulfatiglans anilini]|uniref:phosphate acyltransferase PlsX n=1 Tax=Desulfatiglans anilini TaxID=90728 RepID=UPI00040C2082|nr:phosphate acyltransferase PlsX [Desulfatiglans anilini]
MIVAVDAMGGDFAPDAVVEGAVAAAKERGIEVLLVGREPEIRRSLRSQRGESRVSVHHCEDVVEMGESPLKAVRGKKSASIRVAFELVKAGKAQAVVSAGNSGATLAAGLLTLGKLDGVDRPGIATLLPSPSGPVVLIDAGANVDCRPSHLLQFGLMAHAFSAACFGVRRPRTALLNIGEEVSKGNEQVRAAWDLFRRSPLHFIGNVEGRDILSGAADVIVCDGFVGNVVLKLIEGLSDQMEALMRAELRRSAAGRLLLLAGGRALARARRVLDYAEYGGAPLLGIQGVGMVCHGGSPPRAIKNAVILSARYVENRVLDKMAEQLMSVSSLNNGDEKQLVS